MNDPPLEPHASTPAELRERIAVERAGTAFLVFRDGDGRQRIHPLSGAAERLTLGRGAGTDVCLAWDAEASRVHAELALQAGVWTLTDDGLSANGTWVNGERLRGRRRLSDGDTIRAGRTLLSFRAPAIGDEAVTAQADDREPPAVSPAQRRVLIALARPYATGGAFATPASNQAIASECVLTVDAVKAHLRALFERFGIAELPQNVKRVRLVELAFLYGIVHERELDQG